MQRNCGIWDRIPGAVRLGGHGRRHGESSPFRVSLKVCFAACVPAPTVTRIGSSSELQFHLRRLRGFVCSDAELSTKRFIFPNLLYSPAVLRHCIERSTPLFPSHYGTKPRIRIVSNGRPSATPNCASVFPQTDGRACGPRISFPGSAPVVTPSL